MPSTRQSSLSSSTSKRPTRKVAGGVNYADESPKKVECIDVRKNLGDAWSAMGKPSKTMMSKHKNVGLTRALGDKPDNFMIGNKKTTLVKKIEPPVKSLADGIGELVKPALKSQLPTSLRITKLDSTPKSSKMPVRPGKVNEVWISQPNKPGFSAPTQNMNVAPNQGAAVQSKSVVHSKVLNIAGPVAVLPGQQSVSILNVDETTTADENNLTLKGGKVNFGMSLNTQNIYINTPSKQKSGLGGATTPTSNGVKITRSPHDVKSTPAQPMLKSFSTPVQKPNISSPTLSKSTGRITKKPSIINSQNKAIVKTIKKLNQDQKRRIEERLGDIGSNLQKIKHEEVPEESAPEPIVEKRPLNEVISDPDWLEMFLLSEPTARYNPAEDTLYCHTCRDMSEGDVDDDDGWVKGNSKGVAWLKYREHKLGEEHQKTSTKYFLQLFVAQREN